MNVDIQTEHVAMTPEWRRMIDDWLHGCRKHHPEIRGIDLTLRHDAQRRAAEQVDVVATAHGRRLRAARQAQLMTVALHDALDALERELLVHEAVDRRVERAVRNVPCSTLSLARQPGAASAGGRDAGEAQRGMS